MASSIVFTNFPRSVTIPDIKKDIKTAEGVFDSLAGHAAQLKETADKVYDDASAVKNNAQQQKEVSFVLTVKNRFVMGFEKKFTFEIFRQKSEKPSSRARRVRK